MSESKKAVKRECGCYRFRSFILIEVKKHLNCSLNAKVCSKTTIIDLNDDVSLEYTEKKGKRILFH